MPSICEKHTQPSRANIVPDIESRPDRLSFDSEVQALESLIAPLKCEKDKIRYRINAINASDVSAERRATLHAELEKLLLEQGRTSIRRKELVKQLMLINETLPQKEKELREARAKMCFMPLAQIDAHINKHQRNLESGGLKQAGREVALAEISQGEITKAIHASVKADRAKANELRRLLGAPESKATRTRYHAILAELGAIKKDNDFAYKHRRRLHQELEIIQASIDELKKIKSTTSAKFKCENGKFNKQVREERMKRIKSAGTKQTMEKAPPRDASAEIICELIEFLN